MRILGLTKTTLSDYPGRVAAILFTGGCNLRCPYCHNRSLVTDNGSASPLDEEELFSFLKKRRGVLGGVCISGGEPTLHKDLPDLIGRIKALGYPVKLDTNGSDPVMLGALIHDRLIDYCAMDIKNSPEKYSSTTGDALPPDKLLANVSASIDLLMEHAGLDCEFRTTVVRELHEGTDILAIARWIRGDRPYFLQSYTESDGVLCPGLHAHSTGTMQDFAQLCRPYVPNVALRNI